MRRSAAVVIAVGVIVSGLAAAPSASAAPGDPAPGWAGVFRMAPHDVGVSGSGRVFTVGLPGKVSQGPSSYSHVVGNDWTTVSVPPRSQGGVVAGPGDYAVAVIGNESRVFDGTDWGDPVTITAEIQRSKLVGNSNGDAALLWNAEEGATHLSRLVRGGSWETSRVTGRRAGTPKDVAINEAGKVTVVWAVLRPRSEIRRSVLQPASTTWTTPRRVGTVNDSSPRVSIVTDGQGRETLIAGNKLWRQAVSTQMPAFQFRTSARAKAATGDTATRVVWPVKSAGRYEVRTRYIEHDGDWRDEEVLWSRRAPLDPACDRGIELGVGMVPGGRSYVAAGIRHEADPVNDVCGGQEIADFLTINRFDEILNLQDLGYYSMGGPFQVATGTAGPVVLEYGLGPVVGDPEIPVDGYRVIRFFTR